MLVTMFALVIQAATPPAAATPAPATAASDARCLAAFAVLADDKEKETQDAGVKGMLYFAGKLRGRDGAIDLGAALKAAVADVAPQLEAETLRCSTDLEGLGKALEAAGDAIK